MNLLATTYNCWTENYHNGVANAYTNSICVPPTVKITFIQYGSKEQYESEHRSCPLVITLKI